MLLCSVACIGAEERRMVGEVSVTSLLQHTYKVYRQRGEVRDVWDLHGRGMKSSCIMHELVMRHA
jgi:hypothetical protein